MKMKKKTPCKDGISVQGVYDVFAASILVDSCKQIGTIYFFPFIISHTDW